MNHLKRDCGGKPGASADNLINMPHLKRKLVEVKWHGLEKMDRIFSSPTRAAFVPRLLNLKGQIHTNSNETSLKSNGICHSGKKKPTLYSYKLLIAQRQTGQGCSSFRGPQRRRSAAHNQLCTELQAAIVSRRSNRKWLVSQGQWVLANLSKCERFKSWRWKWSDTIPTEMHSFSARHTRWWFRRLPAAFNGFLLLLWSLALEDTFSFFFFGYFFLFLFSLSV